MRDTSAAELRESMKDPRLQHIMEVWPSLSTWLQITLVWMVKWWLFCDRFKIPGGIRQIGDDFINLVQKF